MNNFEVVSRFKDADLKLPSRSTENAAGYDIAAAEDIIIPPYYQQITDICDKGYPENSVFTLDAMASLTKEAGARPTLVSTGMKCKLDKTMYLELSARSSSPLKYWLVLANGVGIVDSDYYNCEANEGEIFFQFINFSPYPIQIKKGDIIGQGIIKAYYKTNNDINGEKRIGGFGSTSSSIAIDPSLLPD